MLLACQLEVDDVSDGLGPFDSKKRQSRLLNNLFLPPLCINISLSQCESFSYHLHLAKRLLCVTRVPWLPRWATCSGVYQLKVQMARVWTSKWVVAGGDKVEQNGLSLQKREIYALERSGGECDTSHRIEWGILKVYTCQVPYEKFRSVLRCMILWDDCGSEITEEVDTDCGRELEH